MPPLFVVQRYVVGNLLPQTQIEFPVALGIGFVLCLTIGVGMKMAGPKEGKSNAHLLVGKSGFCFKMKLAEGPFKNWYVGVDALPPEAKSDPAKVPDWRPLKLVSDP